MNYVITLYYTDANKTGAKHDVANIMVLMLFNMTAGVLSVVALYYFVGRISFKLYSFLFKTNFFFNIAAASAAVDVMHKNVRKLKGEHQRRRLTKRGGR